MYVCCPKCPKIWVYVDKLDDKNLRCKECHLLFPEEYVPKHLQPSLRALQEVDRAKKDKTIAPESFDISSNDDVTMDTEDLDTDCCKDRIKELQTIKDFCKDKDMDFPEEKESELTKLLQQLQDAEDQKIPDAAPTSKQLHKEYQKLEREAKSSKDKASKMQLDVQLLQQRLEDAKVLAEKEEKDAQDKRKAAADAFNKYSKAKKDEDEKEEKLPQPKPENKKDDPGVGVAEKSEGDELRKQLADREKQIAEMATKFSEMEKMFAEYKAAAHNTPQRKKEDEAVLVEAKGNGGEEESEEEDDEEEPAEIPKRAASPTNRFQTGKAKKQKKKN